MSQGEKELPKGWCLMPLSKAVDVNPSNLVPKELHDSQVVPYFSMASIDESAGILRQPEPTLFRECRSGKTRFLDNDVLFAKITPCLQNGKSALVTGLNGNVGFGSSEFYVLRTKSLILPEYLFYFIRQKSIIEAAVNSFTGTSGRQRVPSNFWNILEILLPPYQYKSELSRYFRRLMRFGASVGRLWRSLMLFSLQSSMKCLVIAIKIVTGLKEQLGVFFVKNQIMVSPPQRKNLFAPQMS